MSVRDYLVKFGQYEHLRLLREEGLLYMNNLPYFWNLEGDDNRGDPFDSVDEVARGAKGTVTLPDGKQFPGRITKWEFRIHPDEAEKINIFCMLAIGTPAGTLPIDERNLRFGDYALVIDNPVEFIKRVGSHLEEAQAAPQGRLVEYVDDDHSGALGPFRKRKRFAYQSEWRVVCYNGPGALRTIRIGSIADFSTIMPSIEINDRLAAQ